MEEETNDEEDKDEEDTNEDIIDKNKISLKVTNDEDMQMKHVKPFPLTYQRGERHVFDASKGQGAMPSSSNQKIEKGKQKVKEEEENHEEEREFELIQIYSDEGN